MKSAKTANRKSITMKSSNSKNPGKTGKKGRSINSLRNNIPQMHDDPRRHQPPTPQDIARVQPISQNNHENHPGRILIPVRITSEINVV